MAQSYDYVIVGAGAAGCVLANRLSARPELRILLLEAGGADSNPNIHMPAGLGRIIKNRRINWDYRTEPEAQLLDRQLYWPRGRVIGGSTSINAMCYTRGHRRDYDEWARVAGADWAYEQVLPFFRTAEDNENGSNEYHGHGGPLGVQNPRYTNVLSGVFVEAAAAAGFARNADFNGATQEGVGLYQVMQRHGARCSAASAYLHPIRHQRGNLTIIARALATRVLIENGRTVGVEYRHQGKTETARAEREVLLSCGAIATPQLLLLSGIGPAAKLDEYSIPVQVDLPEVGRNLQDHLDFCTVQQSKKAVTYEFNAAQMLVVAARYLLTRRGPGTSNIAESGGFVRSPLAVDERPDVQFHFVPAQLDDHGRNRLPGHGYTLHACGLRPRSRGHVTLRSAKPEDPPRIYANYLSDPFDLKVMMESIQLSRAILSRAPFSPYRGREVFPGEGVLARDQIETILRRKAETIYHPVGTCRMGTDSASVVDGALRVRGTEGLRVVDASVMPTLIGGNTTAPTIMIAEKIAAAMLA
jgi:choline dehydrogenase